ncbi:MAG: DUF4389 domain-containing protein [Alphaproteobacteria bacterium]|nr:DUF4389 domain-containing protein [Alphaproteobacteria bacterium]
MSEETEDKKTATKPAPRKKAPAKAAAAKPAARKTAAKKTTTATKAKSAAKPKAAPKKSTSSTKKAAPKRAPAKEATPKAAAAKASDAPSKAEDVLENAQETASTTEAPYASEDTPSGKDSSSFDADKFSRELKDKDWAAYALRGAFMLLFGFLAWIAISFNFVLAGLQFIMLVLTGEPNEFLRKTIMVLGRYIVDVMQYLSFESDDRPFPLGKDLPDSE